MFSSTDDHQAQQDTATQEQQILFKKEIYDKFLIKFKQMEALATIDENEEFLSLGSMDISTTESNDLLQRLRTHDDATLLPTFIADLKNILESYQGQDAEFKNILSKLIHFLEEENLFYPKMNAPTVVLNILEVLTNPSLIDQKKTNLCGVASTVGLLLHEQPENFVTLALELAARGACQNFNLTPHADSIKNDDNIVHAFMTAIKNHYTKTGYTNHSLDFFEPLRGATRPKEIAAILRNLGFDNINEFVIIASKNDQTELPILYRGVLGGVYDKDHKSFSTRLENLNFLKSYLDKHQAAIMLINPLLIINLLPGRTAESFASPLEKINIESTHYVFIKKLEINNSNNNITFSFETCGKAYTHTTSINEFLTHYRGAITADSKHSKQLSLNVNR